MTVKNRSKICLIVSGVIMVIALILTIFGHGINLGIDFEGGLSMEYNLGATAVKGDLEGILNDLRSADTSELSTDTMKVLFNMFGTVIDMIGGETVTIDVEFEEDEEADGEEIELEEDEE